MKQSSFTLYQIYCSEWHQKWNNGQMVSQFWWIRASSGEPCARGCTYSTWVRARNIRVTSRVFRGSKIVKVCHAYFTLFEVPIVLTHSHKVVVKYLLEVVTKQKPTLHFVDLELNCFTISLQWIKVDYLKKLLDTHFSIFHVNTFFWFRLFQWS